MKDSYNLTRVISPIVGTNNTNFHVTWVGIGCIGHVVARFMSSQRYNDIKVQKVIGPSHYACGNGCFFSLVQSLSLSITIASFSNS